MQNLKNISVLTLFWIALTQNVFAQNEQRQPLNLSLPSDYQSYNYSNNTEQISFKNKSRDVNDFWIAAKIGRKQITSEDVFDHIEHVILTESQRMAVFRKADKNYNKYKTHIRTQALENEAQLFEFALKQISYTHLIKSHSLSYQRINSQEKKPSTASRLSRFFGGGQTPQPQERKENRAIAFNITLQDFDKILRDYEEQFLRGYLDQRLGITRARELFGEQLKNQDFPHKQGESPSEVYWRWYRSSEKQLKFEVLNNEVKKWEHYQATKFDRELYIRPTEIHDFYQKNKEKIERELNLKSVDVNELESYLQENSDVGVILENTRIVSPRTMTLNGLIEEYQDHPTINFESIFENLTNKFEQNIKNFTNNVLDYENRSTILTKRYDSAQELTNLANKFDRKTKDTQLMLSRLYRLASQQLKEGAGQEIMRKTVRETLKVEIPNIIQNVQHKMIDLEFYLSKRQEKSLHELSFHQLVSEVFSQTRQEKIKEYEGILSDNELDYLSSSLYMAQFLARTLAKNAAAEVPLIVDAQVCSRKSFDCHQRMKTHLQEQKFKANLNKFHSRELRNFFSTYNELALPSNQRLYSQEAFEFILNQ